MNAAIQWCDLEGSGMPGRIQPDERRPHFFLSYARSRYRPEESDRWVVKFYNDLCTDLGHATGTQNPGFMDRQIPAGSEWPDLLADALANCRIFVALFSPAYFVSDYCGKEWAAFMKRYQGQSAGLARPSAIIPAMWTPMGLKELPDSVRTMQNVPPAFPPAYEAEGLYGIMKLGRFREQYKETVLRLANLIKERAAECALPSSPVPTLETLRSAFAGDPPDARRPAVRLTLAAQTIGQLPEGRGPYYYGQTTREWTPYRGPDHTTPIGRFAEEILGELGHRAEIKGVDEGPHEPGEAPNVLLVDPWAARDEGIGKRLRQIDRDPVTMIAPFNSGDAETAAASAELTEELNEALPRSGALQGSAKHVSSAGAFRSALPKAVNEAITRYLKTTNVHPPRTPPSMGRPTLQGPEF
ncbi:TIR-like protein FxsC [Actinomadura litoris]|uniref:TIR-like protein FxsC n=1 Tax=Actinomadura litoris TaxID=2678616 RepID=UPI0027BAEBE4|nr:TIR-like protein FxsC [Actinomadura litoris]